MGLYELCQTSPKAESEGVWFEYRDLSIRVCLKRAGGANKGYDKALAKLSKDVQRAIDLNIVDNETMESILREVYADEVIAMWETKNADGEFVSGIESPDGSLLPFNRDNVIATLKALPYVFGRIREDAIKHAHYLAAQREAAAGN